MPDTTLNFDHITLGQRVRFGHGRAAEHLAAEVERLAARNVMVISTTRGQADAREVTAGIDVAVWEPGAVMHVPADTAEAARATAARHEVDLLVSIGGGSTTGLAKAVAVTTGTPIVAVPTTYAGSEATNVWGMTDQGQKTTGVDDRALPATVIYDSALSMSLPVDLSVASGLNGVAHCLGSSWGPRVDPINATMAAEGIRVLNSGLPRIVADPTDRAGRDAALYGAYLAAVAFASAGSGLHHKICHVLGGTFNLPHAQTHAVVLPYVLAFNGPFAPVSERRAAEAFGAPTALEGLQRLRTRVRAPRRLSDLGFTADDIPTATDLIMQTVTGANPRPVTRERLTTLLTAAHEGADPDTLTR